MMDEKKNPQKLLSVILERMVPLHDRESLPGDFEEMYDRLVREWGVRRALAWYFFQIIKLLPSFIAHTISLHITMFHYYLKISLRNISRNKFYSFISITGLAIGFASAFLILLYLVTELSYDRSHRKGDRIVRMITYEKHGEANNMALPRVPANLASRLRNQFPEIEKTVRIDYDFEENVFIRKGDTYIQEPSFYNVDPSFFDIFSVHLIAGEKSNLMVHPASVVLTEKIAIKYFGNQNPVGRTLTVRKNDETLDLTVTGIISNFHRHSTFKADILGCLDVKGDNVGSVLTYLLLSERSTFSDIASKIMRIKDTRHGEPVVYKMQPLYDVYLHSGFLHPIWGIQGSPSTITIYSLIGFFIVVVAGINYIILSTAHSVFRSREIGVRKVAGANRAILIRQLIGESIFHVFIALPIALMLFQLFLPLGPVLFGKKLLLTDALTIPFISGFIAITLLVGIFSGNYVAIRLTALKPIDLIRGNREREGRRNVLFRRILILIQMMVFIILIVCTGIVFEQIRYTKDKDLGFDKNNLLIIYLPRGKSFPDKYEIYKNDILKHPEVKNVSGAYSSPSSTTRSIERVKLYNNPTQEIELEALLVDYEFLKTFGLEMVLGRFYERRRLTDNAAIILNETAVSALGIEDPVGKNIHVGGRERRIIGVVKDFHHHSLHTSITPMCVEIFDNDLRMQIVVRLKKEGSSEILTFLESKFKELAPDYSFRCQFVEDAFDNLYDPEVRFVRTTAIFAVLAVFIASLGLFGFSLFIIQQRMKEIGIRKVLGADVKQILLLLIKEFIVLVIAANILSWPFICFIMDKWLRGFAYQIEIKPELFVLTAFLSMCIVMFSVGYHTLKVSRINPIHTIRCE